MVMTAAKRVAARYLRSGDLIHWEGGIGMVRVERSSESQAVRVLVRPAELRARLLGMVSPWAAWSVLHTPVQQLPPDGMVWRVEPAPARQRAAG